MKALRVILWGLVLVTGTLLLGHMMSDTDDGPKLRTSGDSLGGPFTLTAHTGKTVSDTDFEGKYRLIYFGFSFCPDVCPIELEKITAALTKMEAAGTDTSLIQPLFITVDPERDTVEELRQYMSGFHPSFLGLTGPVDTIREVATQYKIFYSKVGGTGVGDYLVNHTNLILLMDKDGSFLKLFGAIDAPEDLARTLTGLVTT